MAQQMLVDQCPKEWTEQCVIVSAWMIDSIFDISFPIAAWMAQRGQRNSSVTRLECMKQAITR